MTTADKLLTRLTRLDTEEGICAIAKFLDPLAQPSRLEGFNDGRAVRVIHFDDDSVLALDDPIYIN